MLSTCRAVRSGRTVAVAAAAAAIAAVPAAAEAATVAKYRAAVEGTQTTTYVKPKYVHYTNCFGRHWTATRGTERVRLRPRSMRVAAHRVGRGVYFTYGSFRFGPGVGAGDSIPTTGTIARQGYSRHGADPGACGGGMPVGDSGPYDCGTKNVAWKTRIHHARGRIGLGTTIRGAYPYFRNCPVSFPEKVEAGNLTEISERMPAADLFNPRIGKHIVLGRQTFRTVFSPGAPYQSTATTTVRWTLTLTRIR